MTSLWQDDAPPIGFDEEPPGPLDVAVVGAGITGLATALALARTGARVAVLEARAVGAVATGSTTAKVSLLQGDRLHRIAELARPDALAAFVEGSRAGQAWLLRAVGAAAEPRDAVSFASTAEGADALGDELRVARSLGLDVVDDGGQLLPVPVAGAIRLAGQAQIQPMRALAALAEQLRALGGAVLQATVRSARLTARGVELATSRGRVRAGCAVLATGAPVPARWTATALEAHRSYAAAYRIPGVASAPMATWPMALSVDRPHRSLRTATLAGEPVLVAGGVGHPVGRHPDPRALVAELDAWVVSLWPEAERTHAWSAQDYRTPDRLPWVGARPGSAGRVLIATGFDKWGMTGGALSALALAGRIAGDEPDWARTLRRRGTTTAAVGRLAGAGARTVRADLEGWREALRPATAPAEGQGALGRRGARLVATSTVDGVQREVSPFCPHIGALVRWNAEERSWDCSAHGSRFAPDGARLEGPSACPLVRIRD